MKKSQEEDSRGRLVMLVMIDKDQHQHTRREAKRGELQLYSIERVKKRMF
jgi:hypothetical protein